MKNTFLPACAILCASLLPLPTQADPYVWDNQNANGIWNDPVNWGILSNPDTNKAPTAADSAIFRSSSPAGTVVLTNDGAAQKIRQNTSAPARIITIGPGATADRTLTLSGTATELIECTLADADLTLDGTPNANGARLKLIINGTQSACPVNGGRSLILNCDVSGTNGISLNTGNSGTGTLILGGTNTYTGPTTVNAGTLVVNGSLGAASAVSVASGATVGGSGTIASPVTIAAGGTLAPGVPQGGTGALTLNGGLTLSGNLLIEVDKSLSPSNDQVTVSAALTNAGTGNVTLRNLGALPLVAGDNFKIFNRPVPNGQALHVIPIGSEVWTNRLAVDGSIAVLPTTNLPPAPTALAATSVTSNSFTANWNSSSGATGYRLDVSTNSLFSSFVTGYQDLDVGNVLSRNVSGLSWGPTHYYRVRAYNANGTSGNSATIAVPPATPPPSGDPTTTFIWNCTSDTDQDWSSDANWVGGVAPKPGTSNIIVFRGDIAVPWNWPNIDTNYGTTILIFSNDVLKNGIKITAGMNHTMNLGSYVLNDQGPTAESPCYFGIDQPIDIPWSQRGGGLIHTTNANFTNALGDASCGGLTDFKCVGGRLDVYGVLKDGLGAHSRLVKSGDKTLNLCGQHANTYTGGTVVNAGPIKMAKPPGLNAIPGDVTVNGTGGLIMNVYGGEQIADNAIVSFNDSASLNLGGQPETVQTVQSASANASIVLGTGGTLTVAPSASVTYSNGVGESDFSGSISGSGTVFMNGTGTYGMLGVNSAASLVVNSGTLKVNGNSGTGAVTVNPGGTLLGKGTIAGTVTVASGGTIGAGFSAGLLTLSAGLDLSAGSNNGPTNVWELAALKDGGTGVPGTDFDQIVLSGGTLALGPQSTLDLRFTGSATAPNAGNPFWQSAHAWTVISMSGGSNPGASSFGKVKNGSYLAGNFTTAADAGGNVVLTFTPTDAPPVPPPRITSITNSGPGSVTVRYTNTVAGANYTLVYNTNLNYLTNWHPAGTKAASGTSDSQTDTSATNGERYYRVYYP
jgi:fibronectin-binding autotransporter adhesin